MKQPCSTHNHFCSAKKKLSMWGSNSWQRYQHACNIYSQKRSRLCEAQTHDLHVTTWCSTTQKLPRTYVPREPKANKLLTSHKRTSWEHDYVRLAQALPRNVSVSVITSLYWSIHIRTYELPASSFFFVSLATIW